ncbi:MAG: tetratricopeptide repeat protein [bacterium]
MLSVFKILLCTSFLHVLLAQNLTSKVKSSAFFSHKEDSLKVVELNRKSWNYSADSPYTALSFADYALLLSKKNNYLKGVSDAYVNRGIIYHNLGKYDLAIKHYVKALKIHESLHYNREIAEDLGSIGIVYKSLNEYDKALDYYTQAISIFRKLNLMDEVASYSSNIGIIYRLKGNLNEALKHLKYSLEVYLNSGEKQYLGRINNNIALVLWDKGNYDSAAKYLENALDFNLQLKDHQQIALTQVNLGGLYLELAKNTKADKSGINPSLSSSERKNLFKKSEFYLLGAEKIALNIRSLFILQDLYNNLSELYLVQNKFKDALDYYKKYSQIKDTLLSLDKITSVNEIESRYKYEKKKQATEKIHIEQQKELNYRNNLQYLAITIFILIFFILIFKLGKYRLSLKILDSLVFVAVLLLFEFILVFVGPFLDNLTSQVPVYILLLNIAVAFLLLPINNSFEKFIKKRLYSRTTHPLNKEDSGE